MKRAVLLGTAMLAGLLVQGCPIFPEEPYGCNSNADCGDGYRCDVYSGLCESEPGPVDGTGGYSGIRFCASPSDCGYSETCTRAGVCLVGDCTSTGYGCVSGYVCDTVSGRWACVPETPGEGGSGGASSSGGSAGEGPAGGTAPTAGAGGAIPSSAGAAGEVGLAGAPSHAGGGGLPAGGFAGTVAGSPPAAAGSPPAAAGSPASAGAAPVAGAPAVAGAPSAAGASGMGASGIAGALAGSAGAGGFAGSF